MPDNHDSDSDPSTPRKVRLTPSEYIAKYTNSIKEVRGTYKNKIMIKQSIDNFVICKNDPNYSQHLDSFFSNDVNQKIKQTLKDENFLKIVAKDALENDNLKLIEKIIPLIEDKKNIEKLNQLLSDHASASKTPSADLDRVRSVIALREKNLKSCNIS